MRDRIINCIITAVIILGILGLCLKNDLTSQYKEACQKVCKKEHTLWAHTYIDDRRYCVCQTFDDELVLIKLAH